MKSLAIIGIIASLVVLSSEKGQAQGRGHAKQTVSFGVHRLDLQNREPQGWLKTVTVAPRAADSRPSKAIFLRSLLHLRATLRNDIPLHEISSKLATRQLMVTISD